MTREEIDNLTVEDAITKLLDNDNVTQGEAKELRLMGLLPPTDVSTNHNRAPKRATLKSSLRVYALATKYLQVTRSDCPVGKASIAPLERKPVHDHVGMMQRAAGEIRDDLPNG